MSSSSQNLAQLTDLLSRLIRFPTITSDQATNRAALDWIEEQLTGLPLHIKRYNNEGYPALVATTRDTRSPKLWLAGHLDVVAASPAEFEPRLHDGRLYGRGAYDMKFALAVYIQLLQDLGPRLAEYDLGLMITCDEEFGGSRGTGWLMNAQGYRGAAALIPDGAPGWAVETGAKGIANLIVSARGKSAHGSRPWLGDNAIDRLIAFFADLKSHINPPAEPCGDPLHLHTTFNIGAIEGGNTANQVPDFARAAIDMRFTPEHLPEEVIAWVNQAGAAYGVTIERIDSLDPSYRLPQDGPVAVWKDAVHTVTGQEPGSVFSTAASDARYFTAFGIPCIVTYINGGDHHANGEWVEAADLPRFYDTLQVFCDAWAR